MTTRSKKRVPELQADLIELIRGIDDYYELAAIQDSITQALSGVPTDSAVPDVFVLLSQDLRDAAATMGPKEARYLMDLYYQCQEIRKRAREQVRSMEKEPEPHKILQFVYSVFSRLEARIHLAMDLYSDSRLVGRWSKLNYGIGPVLAGGLMAHLEIEKAPTVGHIWRFCGLDPTVEWLGTDRGEALVRELVAAGGWSTREVTEDELFCVAAEVNRKAGNLRKLAVDEELGIVTPQSLAAAVARRPYSHRCHVLCWKLGESFKNFSSHPECFYGELYIQRRDQERVWNEQLRFKDQADRKLYGDAKHKPTQIGRNTVAYTYYSQGKLPPSRIVLRSERWAVKIFLAHWHYIEYLDHFGKEPPKPYVLTLPGHSRPLPIPHWPMPKPL